MRAMAGLPSDEKVYFLHRAPLTPPLQAVCPTIDEWQNRLKHGDGVEHNYSLEGHLRLLFFLREVILQDAAVLVDEYSHPVLNHPLFSSNNFLAYKEELRRQMSIVQNPIHQEIQHVMPELCHQISVSNEALTTNIIAAITDSTNTLLEKIKGRGEETDVKLNNFKEVLTSLLKHMVNALEETPPTGEPSISQSPLTGRDHHNVDDQDTVTIHNIAVQELVGGGPNNLPPLFEHVVSHSISTVPEVLQEWEYGLSGRPSVAFIEEKWHNNWCNGTKNQKNLEEKL
jgi:hypothetical protein